jgi:L-lactate dehydrogenase complex protein LldG
MNGPSGRAQVLGAVRAALRDVPETERPADVPVPRDYLTAHTDDGDHVGVLDLLARHLADYRAVVHRVDDEAQVPALVARLLAARGTRGTRDTAAGPVRVAVPDGLPADWLGAAEGVEQVPDGPELTAAALDAVDSVVTGCAVAIAETGTIVLDASAGQGRRMLSLVPDHHVCVVRSEQVVASLPLALPRLTPQRPLTWISGPSATSDIELDRVEGVHGPRTLEVVLTGPSHG